MLKHKRPRLFAVTLRAILVQPRHRETSGGLENIAAVRVVALDTIHPAFDDGVMLRQVEFGVGRHMALKTSGWFFAWIDDELATSAPRRDVFAAGTMARFATGLAGALALRQVNPGMGTGRELANDLAVAIGAGFVADEGGTRNNGRREHSPGHGRTGVQENNKRDYDGGYSQRRVRLKAEG
jgi:hypothetical protein